MLVSLESFRPLEASVSLLVILSIRIFFARIKLSSIFQPTFKSSLLLLVFLTMPSRHSRIYSSKVENRAVRNQRGLALNGGYKIPVVAEAETENTGKSYHFTIFTGR